MIRTIRAILWEAARRARRALRTAYYRVAATPKGVTDYWTEFNVTAHRRFKTAEESIDQLTWRNAVYIDHERLMPLAGFDELTILDYGCGPGIDLVGFGHYSAPARLIGMDVSRASLHEAQERLRLHGIEAEMMPIEEDSPIPLPDGSVDYIHSCGVLHHTTDPVRILREFRRVLRPDGRACIMVYNYDSVFVHLHVAYSVQLLQGIDAALDVREAFSKLTDGPGCPISNVYRPSEFLDMAREAGLDGDLVGSAMTMLEMDLLPKRFDAIWDDRLASEHREFLLSLTFCERGLPRHCNVNAGANGYYVLHA